MRALTDGHATPRLRLVDAIASLKRVEHVSARDKKQYLLSQPTLDVYLKVIQLLPRVAHVGLDPLTQLRELSGSEQLCRTAATRAVLLNQLTTAIEAYEDGKAVFWMQALRLRSNALDDLPAAERNKLRQLF
jgi:hypothetical protein